MRPAPESMFTTSRPRGRTVTQLVYCGHNTGSLPLVVMTEIRHLRTTYPYLTSEASNTRRLQDSEN